MISVMKFSCEHTDIAEVEIKMIKSWTYILEIYHMKKRFKSFCLNQVLKLHCESILALFCLIKLESNSVK